MVWVELRKALRSRVPLFTALAFLIVPAVCALMMVIYKDPEFARELGIISAKANLIGGRADWPFYLNMIAQAVGIGGIMLFSFIATWIFGREWADGTLKDLLAAPVSRSTILAAKFIVAGLWSAAMVVMLYGVGMALGALVGLPLGTPEALASGSLSVLVTALLVIAAVTPVALFASIGRGYLLPIGLAILLLALANVLALLGWGELFPWAAPGMYAALAAEGQGLPPVSFAIVALTAVAGIAGADWWWRHADQDR
jgi:ABC-2 type transport system permease protein